MPIINHNKKKYVKNNKKNEIYNNVYNTRQWRTLRYVYISNHPLCEMCQISGRVTPATEVHHIIPISTAGDDVMKMKALGFNEKNLMALCTECHKKKHI